MFPSLGVVAVMSPLQRKLALKLTPGVCDNSSRVLYCTGIRSPLESFSLANFTYKVYSIPTRLWAAYLLRGAHFRLGNTRLREEDRAQRPTTTHGASNSSPWAVPVPVPMQCQKVVGVYSILMQVRVRNAAK